MQNEGDLDIRRELDVIDLFLLNPSTRCRLPLLEEIIKIYKLAYHISSGRR